MSLVVTNEPGVLSPEKIEEDMKEVTIKYKDSRILELLKNLAKHFDFTISAPEESARESRKKVSFTALKLDTRGYRFNRDEANER